MVDSTTRRWPQAEASFRGLAVGIMVLSHEMRCPDEALLKNAGSMSPFRQHGMLLYGVDMYRDRAF